MCPVCLKPGKPGDYPLHHHCAAVQAAREKYGTTDLTQCGTCLEVKPNRMVKTSGNCFECVESGNCEATWLGYANRGSSSDRRQVAPTDDDIEEYRQSKRKP